MTDRPDAPEGFAPFPFTTGFVGVNGPLYARRDADGRIRLGFRVEERHCNPMRIAHGGMLVTFADMQLPFGARFQADLSDRFLPTIHLATDFLAPAPLGAWVEGETEVLRRTRNLVFAQCLVTADGEPCLRASGIFKIGPEARLDDPALAALFRNE
jgi:uncharacterized protein (TIGR00369 family)